VVVALHVANISLYSISLLKVCVCVCVCLSFFSSGSGVKNFL
jgi:hypothetical protein